MLWNSCQTCVSWKSIQHWNEKSLVMTIDLSTFVVLPWSQTIKSVICIRDTCHFIQGAWKETAILESYNYVLYKLKPEMGRCQCLKSGYDMKTSIPVCIQWNLYSVKGPPSDVILLVPGHFNVHISVVQRVAIDPKLIASPPINCKFVVSYLLCTKSWLIFNRK